MSFDVQAYLRSLSRFGVKPGLERIRGLLKRMGHPEESFPAVHIGGTNGKGSITAMVASILTEAGYKVGMYTSPHLSRYNERIQIDGRPISDIELQEVFAEVAVAARHVSNVLGAEPTEFDVGTAAAFAYLGREQVDVAVVEVGLGGRWDSTNVLNSKAVGLGPVALDHTAVLGPDLFSIANEKVGIFKPRVPAVIAPQPEEAATVIRVAGRDLPCPLLWVREADGYDPLARRFLAAGTSPVADDEVTYTVEEWHAQGARFHVLTPWRAYEGLEISLLGYHQIQNAAVAVSLIDALSGPDFTVPPHAVSGGLTSARWPGRLQLLPGSPPVLLDGGHNPDGARALAAALRRLFPGKKPVFVMAVLGEKDVRGILEPLLPLAAEVIFTRPRSARVPPSEPQDLVNVARALGASSRMADNSERALALASEAAGAEGLVCVCGSLYLVGEVWGGLHPYTDSPIRHKEQEPGVP